MDGPLFWILAVLSAFVVGMGKGGLPVVGMMGVPLLALVISPITAAGILLPVYVLSDIFGLIAYRRAFDKRVLLIICVGMTIGVGIGWATAHLVSEQIVTLIIGLIGVVFALSLIINQNKDVPAKPARWGAGTFWGIVTGFTSFVSHSGAPPFQVWVLPLKLTKSVFVGTTVIAFAYVNAIKLVPYFLLGQLSIENMRIALVLMIPGAIAVFIGVRLVKVVPDATFFRIVTWALLFISIKLVFDGLLG